MATLDRHPPRAPKSRDAIAEEIARETHARHLARRDAFEALFAEWFRNRAESVRGIDGDDISALHGAREDELARLITTTPAVLPWMIFRKLEVLEHYLGEDDTTWTDNREIVMLAGIRADLLRFGIGEDSR